VLTYGDWLEGIIHRVEGDGPSGWQEGLRRYFRALSYRLEKVDLLHGDWRRCVNESILNRGRGSKTKMTGTLFGPPYRPDTCESDELYKHCGDVARDVEIWCRVHEWQPDLRICPCALEGPVTLPAWIEYK
jgi:hypothetical protein